MTREETWRNLQGRKKKRECSKNNFRGIANSINDYDRISFILSVNEIHTYLSDEISSADSEDGNIRRRMI